MKNFTIEANEDIRPRVIQDLGDKGLQEAFIEHDTLICESCDAVIAGLGSVVTVGDKCWQCATRIVDIRM